MGCEPVTLIWRKLGERNVPEGRGVGGMSGGNYSDLMQDYKSLRVGLAVVICATLENTHDTYREG